MRTPKKEHMIALKITPSDYATLACMAVAVARSARAQHIVCEVASKNSLAINEQLYGDVRELRDMLSQSKFMQGIRDYELVGGI